MIYLNVGNIWDNKYLDTVISWNDEFRDTVQVMSLFGSIAGLTPTARSADRLPKRDWQFVADYVDKVLSNNMQIRYTLNQSCIGSIQDFLIEWNKELKSNIRELHNIGVHEWTITSPLLLELMKEMFPYDFYEVSTIVEISTPEDALRWKALGADGANLSTSINRDFITINEMQRSGLVLSILANEDCLFKCP